MATVKLNISLEESVLGLLRDRAAELQVPASRYLAELIRADARRRQDELAAEGYRALSADTAEWAEAALPLALETWPEWEAQGADQPETQAR